MDFLGFSVCVYLYRVQVQLLLSGTHTYRLQEGYDESTSNV